MKSKLVECRNEVFLSLNAQNIISVLHSKELELKMFKEQVKNFCRICVSYRNQWDVIERFAIYDTYIHIQLAITTLQSGLLT